jgi:hypothetical protein
MIWLIIIRQPFAENMLALYIPKLCIVTQIQRGFFNQFMQPLASQKLPVYVCLDLKTF